MVGSWFIYLRIKESNLDLVLDKISVALAEHWLALFFVLVLMPINWGLEAYKWRYLLRFFQKMSFGQSFMATLAGLGVSIWIPLRMGEYLGRMVYLKPKKRIKGVIATIAGNFTQLSVTVFMGVQAFSRYGKDLLPDYLQNIPLHFFMLVFVVGILVSLLSIQRIPAILPIQNWPKAIRIGLKSLYFYAPSVLLTALGWSFLRYMVFGLQFFLALMAFGIDLSLWEATLYIPLIYFTQSFIPVMAIFELGIRVAVSIYFLSSFSGDDALILAAGTFIWLINIILPGLVGWLLLFFAKKEDKNTKS